MIYLFLLTKECIIIYLISSDRKFVSERTEASDSAVASAGVHRKPVSNEEHVSSTNGIFMLKNLYS